MEDQELLQELIDFIRMEIREFKMHIGKETIIEYDLGVTGDDAADLIQHFAKHFHVDISSFDLFSYFNEEPSAFTVGRIVAPLTVGHLMCATKAGRLDDEIIDACRSKDND